MGRFFMYASSSTQVLCGLVFQLSLNLRCLVTSTGYTLGSIESAAPSLGMPTISLVSYSQCHLAGGFR